MKSRDYGTLAVETRGGPNEPWEPMEHPDFQEFKQVRAFLAKNAEVGTQYRVIRVMKPLVEIRPVEKVALAGI